MDTEQTSTGEERRGPPHHGGPAGVAGRAAGGRERGHAAGAAGRPSGAGDAWRWTLGVRADPTTHAYIPEAARLSFPVVGRTPESILFFHYFPATVAGPPRPFSRIVYHPILARVTVLWGESPLGLFRPQAHPGVHLQHRPHDQLFPTLPLPPGVRRVDGPAAVLTRDPVDLDRDDPALVTDIFAALPALAARFPDAPAGRPGRRYLLALAALAPASLLPYYAALHPAFFAWCRGSAHGEGERGELAGE